MLAACLNDCTNCPGCRGAGSPAGEVGNVLEDGWDAIKGGFKKLGHVVSHAAKAVLPDKLVDVIENLTEDAFDFAADRIGGALKDPKTWAIVGAAAVTIASGGVAVGPAMALATDAIIAKEAAKLTPEAWDKLSAKAKSALMDEMRAAAGDGRYRTARSRIAMAIVSSPEFKRTVEAKRAELRAARVAAERVQNVIRDLPRKNALAEAQVAVASMGTEWTVKGAKYPTLSDNLLNAYVDRRLGGGTKEQAFEAAAALLPGVAEWHAAEAFPKLAGDPVALRRAAKVFLDSGGMRSAAKGVAAVKAQVPEASEDAASGQSEKGGIGIGAIVAGVAIVAVIGYAVMR